MCGLELLVLVILFILSASNCITSPYSCPPPTIFQSCLFLGPSSHLELDLCLQMHSAWGGEYYLRPLPSFVALSLVISRRSFSGAICSAIGLWGGQISTSFSKRLTKVRREAYHGPSVNKEADVSNVWFHCLSLIKNCFAVFLITALETNGFRIMSLLRLSPVIPFNAINYIAGVTAISFSA